MDLTFEYYVESDFNELKEMIFGLYDEDPAGLPITEDKIIKSINESICRPNKVKIIMIRNGLASIGYGIITFIWSNEYGGDVVNIDELYIKKEYRNKSAGSRFIKYIMESNKSAKLFTLEITPQNRNALKLYKRLGFEISSTMHMVQIANN